MYLLVNGWRERAKTEEFRLEVAKTLPDRKTLPDSVRNVLEEQVAQLKEESETKDTVLGVSENDQRARVQVFVIRPFESLPGSSLENTLQDQRRMYLYGQKDAKRFLTWLKGECARLNALPSSESLSVLFRVFTQSAQ
jgi:predicted patatin/cPLA2 family phospholipase